MALKKWLRCRDGGGCKQEAKYIRNGDRPVCAKHAPPLSDTTSTLRYPTDEDIELMGVM